MTDFQQKTNKWLPRVAAICAAGVLAGTFAFALNVNKQEKVNQHAANTSLSIACGKAYAPVHLKNAGIDSTRALAIVLLEPEHLQAVCGIVRQALTDTLLDQAPGPTPQSNNEELHELADVLGIDAKQATSIVAKTQAAAKSNIQILTPAPIPSAPGPSF